MYKCEIIKYNFAKIKLLCFKITKSFESDNGKKHEKCNCLQLCDNAIRENC